MTQIILVIGNTGAGKSTHAGRLADETGAHIFTIDEWMRTLFMDDMPDPPEYEWALERTQRCGRQIIREALRLANRDIPVILDLGFFSVEQRTRTRDAIQAGGHQPVLHYLDVDKDTRWSRIEERNRGLSETFQFKVNRDTFEFCETIFEPLTHEERTWAVAIL